MNNRLETPPARTSFPHAPDRKSALALTLALWCLGAAAEAGTIALQSPCPLSGNQNFNGTLGMDFDVFAPITITKLGAFDANQDGMQRPIRVYVFDRDTATAVAGPIEFAPGDDGTLVCASRFKDLTPPLTLNGGFHGCIVAENYGVEEPLRNGFPAGLVYSTIDTGGGRIRFVGRSRWGTAQGAFPGTIDAGPENRFHAGTFEFEAAPGPTITVPPLSQTVVEGQDATLRVEATGAGDLTYQWQLNGADLTFENSPTLTVLNASPGNVGEYLVKVTDANGATTFSPGARLVVAVADAVVVYDPTTITAAGANGYSPGVGLFFEVVPGTSLEVTELGTALHEATLNSTVTVQLYHVATTSVLATVTFDANDTSTPVASTPPLNLWLKPLASPVALGSGNYAVALYGSGGTARYANSPAGVTINGGGAVRHVGSRYVSAAGGPGVLPDTADVLLQYLGPTFKAKVTGQPVIQRHPQDVSVGIGGTATLSVQASGSLPLSYQWMKDGADVPGATSAALSFPITGSLQAGAYRARVSNSFGSVTSAVATVTVAGAPTTAINLHAGVVVFGTVGLHYRVDYREALSPPDDWKLLQDIPALPSTPYVVFDPAPAARPQRAYRAVLLP
jgi:hypothetical protein